MDAPDIFETSRAQTSWVHGVGMLQQQFHNENSTCPISVALFSSFELRSLARTYEII